MQYSDQSARLPIVAVHIPLAFARMCAMYGMHETTLFKKTGLDFEFLEQPEHYLSLSQLATLVSNAIQFFPERVLSIDLSRYMRMSSLGSYGLMLLSAPTLRILLAHCQHYVNLLDPTLTLAINTTSSLVSIEFGKAIPLGNNYYHTQESILLILLKVLNEIIEKPLPHLKIYFDYPEPVYAQQFELINAPIYWNKPQCKFTFSATLLDDPLPGANLPAFKKALRLCDTEQRILQSFDSNWLMKVKLQVIKNIHSPLNADAMASKFCMSRRSFFRKLASYHTTYEEIIAASRAEVAKDYLLLKHMSLNEVAAQLGYNNSSNFIKAFKRWYQLTPNQWRIAQR